MTVDLEQEQKRVAECATAALSRLWPVSVFLTDVTALSDENRRNLILRATVSRVGTPPRSVIIKATRATGFDAMAANAFAESGLVKEWTAAAFLADRAPNGTHCPAFLAGDAARGLVVFEDLGADPGSLVGPLLDGPADGARQALIAYAISLGRLHADTLGCTADHAAALQRFFPASRAPSPGGGDKWRREVVDKVHNLLGGTIVNAEVALVAERLARPGAWLGLAHHDACPDNVLMIDGHARLLDFEFARPGHILLDAAYWRMGFPTCWCAGRVPRDVQAAMDRAYRQALAAALPAALDDVAFMQEMAILLFTWMYGRLAWLLEDALKEDKKWGISTYRSRLLWYLEAAADGATASGTFNGLRDTALRWRAELGKRWPEVQPLALYPAFAG
jgi:Phosphotransferase enzyme family